ncbi:retropepsin-like aspartic protease family protein [Halovulum sp. GXIMD14793]
MSEDQSLRLLYFVLLGLFVGSYFLFNAGKRLSETLKNALLWLCIFIVVLIGYANKDLLQTQLMGSAQSLGDGKVTLTRSFDGHYYADLEINGAIIPFVVDTGASQVVLNREDAARAGFDVDELRFWGRASTANGEVRTAPVRLDDVRFGDFHDTNVQASVNGAELDTSLLGMSYLERFELRFVDNKLHLIR